jgi:hypothetical protein
VAVAGTIVPREGAVELLARDATGDHLDLRLDGHDLPADAASSSASTTRRSSASSFSTSPSVVV